VAGPGSGDATQYDLLVSLNYYAPYVSGLTETAKVVAEGLAARGWRVCVVTAQHDKALPRREVLAGVDVVRTPVVARIGKGTVSPSLPWTAIRMGRRSSVVNLHMPMLEAGVIARGVGSTPVVATYQCDVDLPPSALNRLQVHAMDASSRTAVRRAVAVVPSSEDYARHSRVWAAMAGRIHPISPPCQLRDGGTPRFRRGEGQHVGFLGRIVEEKGLEYLVEGFLAGARPDDRLLVGGDHTKVAGGSVIDRVRRSAAGDPRVELLGFIPDDSLDDFYASLDVFALPSVNSLEAFGIVQVEAMMCGVPSVASDIPGVRTPVENTGFGEIVAPRDPKGIAAALTRLSDAPPDRSKGAERSRELYGVQRTLDAYEELLSRCARERRA
jgi:glycosyltransferase involved in cell wall biosynthesis